MKKNIFALAVILSALVFTGCSQKPSEQQLSTTPTDTLTALPDNTSDLTQAKYAQPSHEVYSVDGYVYQSPSPLVNLLTLKVGDYSDDEFRAIENKQIALVNAATAYWQDFLQNEQAKYFGTKEQFFCDVTLLGYDDLYAYAKTLCQGYTVNESGVIEKGAGQGDWMRFEYSPPSLSIVDFKLVGNDTAPNRLIPDELLK